MRLPVVLPLIFMVVAVQMTSCRPIDELLAIIGNFHHGKANPEGRYEPSGKTMKVADNEEIIIEEYDIAYPMPGIIESSDEEDIGKGRRFRRAAVSTIWPNKKIPYIMVGSYDNSEIEVIEESMNDIHRYSCLRWVKKTGADDKYVEIGREYPGCWSYVGQTGDTKQRLNLALGCAYYKKTAIHELLHATGIYHEQSRSDRDDYVTINWDNVQQGKKHNFDIRGNGYAFGIPYDYRSVMHYGASAFSAKGGTTIVTKDAAYQSIIGNAPTIGFNDIRLLNAMYSCAGGCQKANCPADGFQGQDCKCYCYSGDPSQPITSCSEVSSSGCIKVNQPCGCRRNGGSNPCNLLPNTQCSSETNACECLSGYKLTSSGECSGTVGGSSSITNDGSTVSPFTNVGSGSSWTPSSTPDATSNGITANGQVLLAQGNGPDIAALKLFTTVGPGNWCVSYLASFYYSVLQLKYTVDGGSTGTYTLTCSGDCGEGGFYPIERRIPDVRSSLEVQFIGASYNEIASWSCKLDNIWIHAC